MSTTPGLTKRELRDQRRAEREAAEHAANRQSARKRAATRLGGAVLLAAAILVVAVALTSRAGKSAPTSAQTSGAARQAAAVVAGIPESKGVLGASRAKVTVTEYLDLQCPVCKAASRQLLPSLISDYVKPGKVKLQARTLHFIGADSTHAAEVAAGALAQGRFWAFVEAFYATQGQENSGYVTGGFLRGVAKASGVNADAALAYAKTSAAQARLDLADADAAKLGIDSTPTFVVQKGDAAPRVVDANGLQAALQAVV